MPVDVKKQVRIRIPKDEAFIALQALDPSGFGVKDLTQASYFGDDPNDASYILIEFGEESEAKG